MRWVAILATALLAGCNVDEPLPMFSPVPVFSLTAQDGRTVSRDDYEGRVWIANFVFTNCEGPCPLLSSHMRKVQDQLEERGLDVALVSFSVDPEHDTPEVLATYGRAFGADFERWSFLTGDKNRIYNLILDGFKLAVSDGAVQEGLSPAPGVITHSTRFALIDQQGWVRGYYFGEEPGMIDVIVADAERVLTEGT